MRPFLTLHNPKDAKAYYDQGLWTDETFYGLMMRHAEARPNAVALRDGRAQLTWHELAVRVDAIATDLRGRA